MCADQVDLSDLPVEIEKFKRLVQSSDSAFHSNAPALCCSG